ncbi:MAG: hypothetical protein Q8P35_01035 [Candidatus Yanofskybacteria bacterium]|nr:hypothetical protein [Candidatus Yanofskybacteria bacterium]
MNFRHVGYLLMAGLLLSGCATGRISVPRAWTDPEMNFDKIRVVAVLPMFPQNVEDQVFSGAFGSQLEGALVTRQSQWRIVSSREVLQVINRNNLGNGYKNLQADMNVPSSGMGQIAYSPGTNAFVMSLKKTMGADAIIVGTYNFGSPSGGGLMGALTSAITSAIGGTRVKVSLLYVNGSSAKNWWSAELNRRRINDEIIQEMAASVAANIGKGTLLQL